MTAAQRRQWAFKVSAIYLSVSLCAFFGSVLTNTYWSYNEPLPRFWCYVYLGWAATAALAIFIAWLCDDVELKEDK